MASLQAAPTTQFAIKLLASDGEFQPKECSPLGLWFALGILAKASEGKTQEELLQLLDESASVESVDQTLLNIKEMKALELSLGLFAREGIRWKEPFLDYLKRLYSQIHVATCPFYEPEKALYQINSWAKEATKGEIPKLLQKDDIDSDTVSYLLSALYFARNWAEPFKKEATEGKAFSIGDETKQVRTMHSVEYLPYASCSFGEYIEKPLARETDGKEYVGEFFLPSGPLNKEELEEAFSLCRKQAAWQRISLSLPQSKGKSSYVWNNWLKNQGISTLFSDNAAFSRLCYSPLAVQQIKEATSVSLTESGVIVADVVAISFRCTSCPCSEPPIELHFDKPFFFLVREKESDTVVSCSYIGSFKQLNVISS